MPKEHFSVSGAASLSTLNKGDRIHVSGVAGVAMAQLAVALTKLGYQVSGSDKEFYEPMGSFLNNSPVRLFKGYSANNLPQETKLVVIGNALSYGNEEVLEVEKRNLPYTFFPKLLNDIAIKGRHSVVVSGTHGKSTTTSMLAWLFTKMKLDPSYFIGAAVPDLPTSLNIGSGKFTIVEGDEYDSAFFAKVPKFSFYEPDTLIVTAIEYDHADIYPDLQSIVVQFNQLINSKGKHKRVLACVDCANVRSLVQEWKKVPGVDVVTYGTHDSADFRLASIKTTGAAQQIQVHFKDKQFKFNLAVPGEHNARNAAAALLVCIVNALDVSNACKLIQDFQGARRRQEVRVSNSNVVLIDDFAHHPTAVKETIAAVKSFYPKRKLWAIFEPRSNTSRRKVFQNDYVAAFAAADKVILCDVTSRAIDQGHELIAVQDLANEINKTGVPAVTLADAQKIHDYILQYHMPGDLLLVMSNGGFGGLVNMLEKALS